jgi:hypothetical protein
MDQARVKKNSDSDPSQDNWYSSLFLTGKANSRFTLYKKVNSAKLPRTKILKTNGTYNVDSFVDPDPYNFEVSRSRIIFSHVQNRKP